MSSNQRFEYHDPDREEEGGITCPAALLEPVRPQLPSSLARDEKFKQQHDNYFAYLNENRAIENSTLSLNEVLDLLEKQISTAITNRFDSAIYKRENIESQVGLGIEFNWFSVITQLNRAMSRGMIESGAEERIIKILDVLGRLALFRGSGIYGNTPDVRKEIESLPTWIKSLHPALQPLVEEHLFTKCVFSPRDGDRDIPTLTKEEVEAFATDAEEIIQKESGSYSFDLDQGRKKISPRDGVHFNASGISRGSPWYQLSSLIEILTLGEYPYQGRGLYTAFLRNTDENESMGAVGIGASGPYVDGGFIIVSQKDRPLKNGVESVLINKPFYSALNALQSAFPNVTFIRGADLDEHTYAIE